MEPDIEAREAAEHLAAIRRIMESATKITALPGKAALTGGALALGGCAGSYALMRSLDFAALAGLPASKRAAVIALWGGVGILAVLCDVVLSVRLARRNGRSPWSRLEQLALYAMGPCLGVALALTLALGARGDWGLAPGIWMMLYGAAVWMTGILSVRAPGILGAVFVAFGIATVFWVAPIALIMVALTFGAGHIAYGVYLLRRFGE